MAVGENSGVPAHRPKDRPVGANTRAGGRGPTLALLLGATLAGGCTLTVPRYTPNYVLAAELREAGLSPVTIGVVEAAPDVAEAIERQSVRAATAASPYGSYVAYLRAALEEDLARAGLLVSSAPTTLEATLLANRLNASGTSVGYVELEARVTLARDGARVYDSVRSVRHEWASHFVGDVAANRALTNYPVAVRKLVAAFLEDPAFKDALR